MLGLRKQFEKSYLMHTLITNLFTSECKPDTIIKKRTTTNNVSLNSEHQPLFYNTFLVLH